MNYVKMSHGIKSAATLAMKSLDKKSSSYKEAALRRNKPMDYLRCMEFPLTYQMIQVQPHMKILDIASPQWFSIYLCRHYSDIYVEYLNNFKSEIEQIQPIAQALNLNHWTCSLQDCRQMNYADRSFDLVYSISAIEHVEPDIGGDVAALKEIKRVLKPNGQLILSLPLKSQRSCVYDEEHDVWSKKKGTKNFYMRNYDWNQIKQLAEDTGFNIEKKEPMFERPGLMALQYWEWGPGQTHPRKNAIVKFKKKIDKAIGLRLEGFLAAHYLKTAKHMKSSDRLVNTVLSLRAKSSRFQMEH